MDYSERPVQKVQVYHYFIRALDELKKKNGNLKFRRHINRIVAIDKAISYGHGKKRPVDKYNSKLNKLQDEIQYEIVNICSKGGSSLLKRAGRQAVEDAHHSYDVYGNYEYVNENEYGWHGDSSHLAADDFYLIYKRVEKVEKKIETAKEPERTRTLESLPIHYPRADNIGYSEARSIAATTDEVQYFLNGLSERQFARHVNNIRQAMRKDYSSKLGKQIDRELDKIKDKDDNHKLGILAGEMNFIFGCYYTEDSIIDSMKYEIRDRMMAYLDKTREKVVKIDPEKSAEKPYSQQPTSVPNKQSEATKNAVKIEATNWTKMKEEKKKFDELYKAGKFKELNESDYSFGTDERKIAGIINRFYDKNYDLELTKFNMDFFGVNALFELAEDLAVDMYESTILNAKIDSSVYNQKLHHAYAMYSLTARMEKFNKFRKRFDAELNKLDPVKKERVLAIIAEKVKSTGIIPTQEGIIKNVGTRERQFLMDNAKNELSARNHDPLQEKYDLKTVATHIPLDQIPKIYEAIVKQIQESFYYNENREKAREAFNKNRLAEGRTFAEAADAEDIAHAVKQNEVIALAQREFSDIILSKLTKIDIKTNEKRTQILGEICRKYLNEEPRFTNSSKSKEEVDNLEVKKRYEAAKAEFAKKSALARATRTVFGLKPDQKKIGEEVAEIETDIPQFGK